MTGGATMPGWVFLAMLGVVLGGVGFYLRNRDR